MTVKKDFIKVTPHLVIVAFFLIACNQKMINTESEEQKLINLTRDWSDSVGINSVDKNLSYYTDDAIMMAPGEPVTKGKEAMRSGFEATAKNHNITLSWAPITVSVSKRGDMAYMTEENMISIRDSSGNSKSRSGKGVIIWKKQLDGNWKVALEIWNSMDSE